MDGNNIIFDDLKIKSIKDIAIPKPFELLVQAEDHYFNLNQENFEDSVKFFEQFIKEGPGETQEENFHYLQHLHTYEKPIKSFESIQFKLLVTLQNILYHLTSINDKNSYDIANDPDFKLIIPFSKNKLPMNHFSPNDCSNQLTQILLDDDVTQFQQYFSKKNFINSYINFIAEIYQKPSINIIKYILISDNLPEEIKKEDLVKTENLAYAISSGNIELIRLLEQQGANYDNCLTHAFKSRNSDLIDWFIENYQQKIVDNISFLNLRSVIFCLENNICSNYYDIYKTYYDCNFKSILEHLTTYKHDFIQKEPQVMIKGLMTMPNSSIIGDCLKKGKYDYFNIFYDLGLAYTDGFCSEHPLSYLVSRKNYDFDFYEKIYQLTQRNKASQFHWPQPFIYQILSNMDLLKFFLDRQIFPINLDEVLRSCGLEEMKYIFDNYKKLDENEFIMIFSDRITPWNFKPELIKYILENFDLSLDDYIEFNLLKFAFSVENMELMNYLLDKGVKPIIKLDDYTGYIKYDSDSDSYDYDDESSNTRNVMDGATHSNYEAYKLILERGGKGNAKGYRHSKSILDYHISKGNFEIVKLLVEHGAVINMSSLESCLDERIFSYLVEQANDVKLHKNHELLIKNDKSSYHFLLYAKKYPIKDLSMKKHLECLSRALKVQNEIICIYLLKNIDIEDGEKIDHFPRDKKLWLFEAVTMNSPECVKLLLEFIKKSGLIDRYFDQKKNNKSSEKDFKERKRFDEMYLDDYENYLDDGKRFWADDDDVEEPILEIVDSNYFLQAAKLNNTEIVKILIEHNVPIQNVVDNYYINALFWAAIRGNVEMINLLLHYGYEKLNIREEDAVTLNIHPDLVKMISY